MKKTSSDELDIIIRLKALNIDANDNLGITKEYNKDNRNKLWDSKKRKDEFKEKVFCGKKTYKDNISGNILHKEQKAAQNKYHMKNDKGENISSKWANHSAETDHINALNDVHSSIKNNPFLTDDDFRDIMNRDENYRILSKRDNTSKGSQNDWDIIENKDNGLSKDSRKQMAKEKIKSDIYLKKNFTVRTAKNIGKEFGEGAKASVVNSIIPLTTETIKKICNVAKGNESISDAAKDIAKTTVNAAVVGGTNRLLKDIANTKLKNSNNEVLKKLAGKKCVNQVVMVASLVKDSAVRYINGEIDGKEFVEEVGAKGLTMVVGMIGGEVGKEIGTIIGGIIGTTMLPGFGTTAGVIIGSVIGDIVATLITTVACSAIISFVNTSKHLNDYKLKEKQVNKIEKDALREMSNQREILKGILKKECKFWNKEVDDGFNMVLSNACKEVYNLEGITKGLDKVLRVFGKEIAFKNIEEYEAQIDGKLVLSFGKR